jgi:hypothetical protein
MFSLKLDPELEWVLDHDVDDLARYNILRYLHDRPEVRGDVGFFCEELGLRSHDRTEEALEGLSRAELLTKVPIDGGGGESRYGLCGDMKHRELVDRLYRLSGTALYGEIVERLAARSLRRARKAQLAMHTTRHVGGDAA